MESNSQKFHRNSSVDPKTGEKLIIGSRKYNKLVEKYGDVKIVSPKTNKKITIGKGEYQKLLNQGYTQDELLND